MTEGGFSMEEPYGLSFAAESIVASFFGVVAVSWAIVLAMAKTVDWQTSEYQPMNCKQSERCDKRSVAWNLSGESGVVFSM